MNNIQERLKGSYPNFSDRIDRMTYIANTIVDSKDAMESMNNIVKNLDVVDAFVFGMITGEMILDGTLHISGLDITQKQKMKLETN
jgi:hypothetical protein